MKYLLVLIMLNGDVYQTGYESLQLCKANGMLAVLSLQYIHPKRKVVEGYCKPVENND